MLEGLVNPGFDSLVNVREKLQQLLQQFNALALATPDFDWALTLQGIRIAVEATAGDANAGFGEAVATLANAGLGTSLEPNNVRYYSLGTGGAGIFQANGDGGDDGDKPTLGDYQDAFAVIDSEVDLFNLLISRRTRRSSRTSPWTPQRAATLPTWSVRDPSEMTHQVRQFFLNGGSQAYVVRIADNADEAGVELNNEVGLTVLEVTAKEAGSEGDRLRIEIDYDTPQPDQTFNLRVFRFVVEEPQPAVVNPAPGIAIAGRVLGDADPDGELAALIAGGQDTLRISLDGGPAEDVDLSGDTSVVNIQTSITSHFGGAVATVTLESIGAGAAARNLFLITNAADEDVVVEATGNATSDFGAAMQLGADRGGLDLGAHGLRRPAQRTPR